MTKTINQLPPAVIAALTDLFEIENASGVSQKLTASQISGLFGFQTVYKTADQTISNQTTLVNDVDLRFPMDSNSLYAIQAQINAFISDTPSFKCTFTGPALTTARWSRDIDDQTLAKAIDELFIHQTPIADLDFTINFSGTIKTLGNSGDVIFQWAQNISDVKNTILREGSWIMFKKLN